MAKFEFKDRRVNLDIAGAKFVIEANAMLAEKAKGWQPTFLQLDDDKKNDRIGDEDVINICVVTLDDLLGEGACETIFEGRQITVADCLDILEYILDEVEAFNAKAAQNREQRRAAQKKKG